MQQWPILPRSVLLNIHCTYPTISAMGIIVKHLMMDYHISYAPFHKFESISNDNYSWHVGLIIVW